MIKKTITIEFEAERDEDIKRQIDLLKSAIEKDNRCPIIKINIINEL